jgi:hypothetical protein
MRKTGHIEIEIYGGCPKAEGRKYALGSFSKMREVGGLAVKKFCTNDAHGERLQGAYSICAWRGQAL